MNSRPKHLVVSEVERALGRAGVVKCNRLLIACSGGADSTALLCALAELRDSSNIAIAAGYFDHGLRDREEIFRERELLHRLCVRLQIELFFGGVDPGVIDRIASIARRGIEDACRQERYRFLKRTMQEGRYDRIVLGHNRNDQAETVIQRLFQGSGPGGISGISADEAPLLRPLIQVGRSEIIDYLKLRKVEYSFDSSNIDGRFLRNRIRNELIPLISDIFPGYLRGIGSQAEKADLTDLYLRDETSALVPMKQKRDFPEISINRDRFYSASPILRLYAVHAALNRLNLLDDLRADRVPYRAIRAWAFEEDDGVRENRIVLRTKSREIERTKSHLVVRSRVVFEREKSYLWVVHEPGEHVLFIGEMCLLISETTPETSDLFEIFVSEFPVVFRSLQTADTLKHNQHNRRVSELFLEDGEFDRQKSFVIEDRAGIVAAIYGAKTVVRDSAGFTRRLLAQITHVKDERIGYERTGKAEQSRR